MHYRICTHKLLCRIIESEWQDGEGEWEGGMRWSLCLLRFWHIIIRICSQQHTCWTFFICVFPYVYHIGSELNFDGRCRTRFIPFNIPSNLNIRFFSSIYGHHGKAVRLLFKNKMHWISIGNEGIFSISFNLLARAIVFNCWECLQKRRKFWYNHLLSKTIKNTVARFGFSTHESFTANFIVNFSLSYIIFPWFSMKVQSAQAAIDFSRPSDHTHVLIKLKKIQKERERMHEIERENQRLLQKLSQIMSVNRLENFWKQPHPNFLNRVYIKTPTPSSSSSLKHRRAHSVPPPSSSSSSKSSIITHQITSTELKQTQQNTSHSPPTKSRSCMRCPTCSGKPITTKVVNRVCSTFN